MTSAAPDAATAHHLAVVESLEPEVERALRVLPPPAAAWQPADYLPDLQTDGWRESLSQARAAAAAVPEDLLVVLVGDMVTEEALPSYSMALNTLVRDTTGMSPRPWARWLRGWTAEENRHGDLLNAYLRLTGRVDMRAVERTIQTLLVEGFTSGAGDDPYGLLVYTSFQERATRLSHRRVAALADEAGDGALARICRVIAGDEARHEQVYTRLMGAVLDADPEGGVQAVAGMLDRQIVMPGVRMGGADQPALFDDFATVAQRLGVYTAADYASIVAHLVARWNIAGRRVAGAAARDQERVCRLAERLPRVAERVAAAAARRPAGRFPWIAPAGDRAVGGA